MKIIQPRHLKRREPRAPEAGFSTARGNREVNLSPARGWALSAGLCLAAALLIVLLTGPVSSALATETVYRVLNILNDPPDYSIDLTCTKTDFTTAPPTAEMVVDGVELCKTNEDKVKFIITDSTPTETELLVSYFDVNGDQAGYLVDTDVAGQATGNDINFKVKNGGGYLRLKLIEANPSTGAVRSVLATKEWDLTTVLSLTAGNHDLSALSGLVPAGSTFGFQWMFVADDPDIAEVELKFGASATGKQLLFNVSETAAPLSAAVSGTITPFAGKSAVVSGGKTIIIDLTGDTWVAAGGTFDAQRQNIIDGLDSAQSETTGWDNEVRGKQGVTGVVRTSDTRVTITLDAQSGYDITATETITVTVPASALVTSSSPAVATPTFDINLMSADLSGTITPSAVEGVIVSGGKTIIIDLTGDRWEAVDGTFAAQRQNINTGLDSALS
jgi:hypothetical protein